MLRLLGAARSGLQASPSKHAGYSVRVENAVPMVTQAPRGPAPADPVGAADAAGLAQRHPADPPAPAWQQLAHTSVQHATVIPTP
ncbi:hypothetical protein ANANG_G00316400 [Anguilla anguilla]|uniref:Uncharacterized protein n=1 Tax=Anguilla anguilla TaxID=7936 RepID=A0A9D3LHU8_ANGAN|nr:hypothetical protein ANANG_G00316400 [Anguilla anguilla]